MARSKKRLARLPKSEQRKRYLRTLIAYNVVDRIENVEGVSTDSLMRMVDDLNYARKHAPRQRRATKWDVLDILFGGPSRDSSKVAPRSTKSRRKRAATLVPVAIVHRRKPPRYRALFVAAYSIFLRGDAARDMLAELLHDMDLQLDKHPRTRRWRVWVYGWTVVTVVSQALLFTWKRLGSMRLLKWLIQPKV